MESKHLVTLSYLQLPWDEQALWAAFCNADTFNEAKANVLRERLRQVEENLFRAEVSTASGADHSIDVEGLQKTAADLAALIDKLETSPPKYAKLSA